MSGAYGSAIAFLQDAQRVCDESEDSITDEQEAKALARAGVLATMAVAYAAVALVQELRTREGGHLVAEIAKRLESIDDAMPLVEP